ncbi:MAG: monovalent cation/H(+) antiporter subunit G [Methanoregula sp.]|jgi:multicomponent Na+:H+ antiporter subunit G|uniref:monovalent cation/H(+) antiporter subunit G n=1 Tax=Methanoregula sp. TaxID=2052170 RepID=UPI0025F23D5E|nr:monovalent cation/H(+) antiporter subunit G [Methanoregula sp.]MCK9631864.1 monovalent cation/H(+) antiporter subunit G [Methanoregula sp.]
MSSLVADIIIWILLAGGIGFVALGFIGLLIFPDIKSRMFTASRATLIGVILVTLSVVIFGINGFLGGGGERYTILIIHTVFLFAILMTGRAVISRIISDLVPGADAEIKDPAIIQE